MSNEHANNDESQTQQGAPFDADASIPKAQAASSAVSQASLKAQADQILAEAKQSQSSPFEQDMVSEGDVNQNDLIASQRDEILALKDKLLRALAEAENVRRRTAREVEDARNFAITKFARDMLTVQDNLERALAALGDTAMEEQSNVVKSMVEGVELTRNDLLSTLERNGIKPLVSDGTRFDPKHHQALFELESDAEPGTVIQTMQVGYTIGERNLRPAMVGVAKAPVPGSPQATSAEDQ